MEGAIPGRLQHHDRVLALVGAGGRELHVDVGQGAAAGVAVAAARHAAHLDGGVGGPGGEGLEASREGVELQGRRDPQQGPHRLQGS